MKHHRQPIQQPRDKTTDKAFVLAVLRAMSRQLKSMDGMIEAAGVGLSQGLISPAAAITMANLVAPGWFEQVMTDFDAAEIGAGYSIKEAAE